MRPVSPSHSALGRLASLLLASLLLAGLLAAGCSRPPATVPPLSPAAPPAFSPTTAPALTLTAEPNPEAPTLAAWLAADPRFTRLASALQATDIWAMLADETRRLTLFAPVNSAFADLPPERVDQLQDPGTVRALLLHHLWSGLYSESTLLTLTAARTELGETVVVIADQAETAQIGEARVLGGSVALANGIVFAIDQVLWPKTAQTLAELVNGDPRLTRLRRAVQRAGLAARLSETGPYTLFAPTDKAFAALTPEEAARLEEPAQLQQVLLYHLVAGDITAAAALDLAWSETLLEQPVVCVVQGNLWMINDAQVLVSDVPARNGRLHLISEVLFPPIDLTP